MDFQKRLQSNPIGRALAAIGICAAGFCTTAPSVMADDFRIETVIFAGEEEEQVSKASTLFEQGVVYDFLSDPPQVAVFRRTSDKKPGRFILLDIDRKVRTELTTDKIDRLLGKLRAWSTGQSDPLLQFIADPKFEEKFDEAAGELTLTHDLLSYRAATAPGTTPEAMAAYRTFCDWYARLNAVTQHGMLPYPRLRLNAALDELGRVPTHVTLTVPGRQIEFRAEHTITWRLSKSDRRRTDEVRRQLRDFQLVDNAEFRSVKQLAAKGQ